MTASSHPAVRTIELPGLFDLQVNGFGGVDFNGPGLTADGAAEALDRMRATGVTRCLPTLITSSFDRFAASARILARIADAAIAGIHMEGPYLSPADGPRGAHPREHVGRPSVDDFRRRQEAADGRIGLVTLAPEAARRARADRASRRGGCPRRDRPYGGDAGTDRRRDRRRRDAGDAPRQRLRRHPAAASECDLGAARRRRRAREPDRRRPPPAAGDGQGHDPGQGRRSGRSSSPMRSPRRAVRARRLYDRRRWTVSSARRPRLAARHAVSGGLER